MARLTQYKARTLEQQLSLARQDTEWARSALQREHETNASARAELTTRLTRAETALDLATQERSSAAAQLAQAERALNDTQAKHAESAARIAQLQSAAAAQEHDARLEINGLQRTIELGEARVQHAERRAAQLEAACDELVAKCGEREGAAQDLADEERAATASLREENAALQAALDRLAASLGVQVKDGEVEQPSLSTAASFAAHVQRDGKSFSEVYLDLVRTDEELRRERAETGRLEGVLAEVMADLDAHAPQLKAQRDENAALRAELDEALAELATAAEVRDAAQETAAEAQRELARVEREHTLVTQQLEDTGLQVRTLLREVILLRDPSAAERMEDDGTPLDVPSTDIHTIITQELVTFRSLSELCAQNKRLLHALRELGNKMEAMDDKAAQSNDDAVQEAAALLEKVRDELEAERASSENLRRERDMFRSACLATESAPPPPVPAADTEPLRTELVSSRAEAQRACAARDAAQERLAILQHTAELHQSQLAESRQQMERLHGLLASRDQAVQAKEQALLTNHGTIEQLRAELASATTEARVSAEQRDALLDENSKLSLAKSTAEQALAEAQSVRTDDAHKRSSEYDRLRDDAAQLRIALAAAEARAGEEQTQATNATLRREIETRALQERLDTLVQQHTSAREALATAQANAMHAERRATDLLGQLEQAKSFTALFEKQLAAAEESRKAAAAAALGAADAASASGLSPERQLEMELMDVRRGRAAAQAETLEAKEKLQASVDAQTQLQQSLDAAIAERDAAQAQHTAAATAAEQASAEHQAALAAKDAEVTSLREALDNAHAERDAQKTAFANEKRELEDALAGLSTAEKEAEDNAPQAWDEVRKFARAAKEAETRAADAAHAQSEAQGEIERLRTELQRVVSESDALRHARDVADAENNRSALAAETHARSLEKTIDTLKTQRDELQEQNTQLHGHLEAVGKRSAAEGEADVASAGDLHQVIRYLRREKEALELQAELARQEQARLRQALDKAEQDATALRTELAEAKAPSDAPNTQYAELLDKINQLSSLREHVTTLKEAKQALETRAESLSSQLSAAQQELQPGREQLQSAQVELETCQSQLRVVQEDVARWKSRTEGLLKSSGVTEALEKAEAERKEAQAQVETARAELESEKTRLSSELQTANARFEQLREQVRARITQERRSVAEATERGNQLQQEKDAAAAKAEEEKKALEEQVQALQAKIDEQAKEPMQTDGQPEAKPEAKPESKAEGEGEQPNWEAEKAALAEQLRAKTEECEKHKNFARTFLKDKRAAEALVKEKTAQLEELEKKLAEGGQGKGVAKTEGGGEAAEGKASGAEATDSATDAQPEASESKPETAGSKPEASESKPETAGATPAADAPTAPEDETVEGLRKRIAELESLLAAANARIAELEAASASSDTAAKDAKIEELTKQLAAPDGLQAAIEAKEAELKAHYQSLLQTRYDDGKHEATLRNTIMLKQRDNKITKLTAEIQELKIKLGIASDAPAPKPTPKPKAEEKEKPEEKSEAKAEATPARPAVVRGGAPARGGRGGGPKPVPLLQRAKPAEGTSIRGAAATRGAPAKRGAVSVAVGAKRKRELAASTSSTDNDKPKGAPKKSRGDDAE